MDRIFEIRPCRASDLPAIRDLLIQLAEASHAQTDFELSTLQSVFAAMEKSPEIYQIMVATFPGDQVVGFISVLFYKTVFHKGGTALINELIVEKTLRGTGIGKALIEFTIEEARRRGMDEVEVGTETNNSAAQKFYHKCGFDEEYVLLGMEF